MNNQITVIDTDKLERPSIDMDRVQVKHMMNNQGAESEVIVVVQTYGRIEKTKRCVESILKYTMDVDFELWLLDNGSEEKEILDFFESVAYEPKRIIRITKNITGVFSINTVIHLSSSKYLVIVNNDIVVTQNWLNNLLVCAQSDPRIGMVCPVSTNISNRQEETLGGFADLDEMQMKAEQFNRSDSRKWEERLRVIPTATLYRKEVFDDAGVYDVGFVYDFGDDDFSFRVRRAGYKLIVCRDTFVHHDHYLWERDMEGVENKRFKIGKENFRKKYCGLDAWEDGENYIGKFSHYGDFGGDKAKKIHILGVDVRCGTPILEVKNKFKAEGYFNFGIDAFTTDLKYYIDLNSIADSVEHGSIVHLTSQCRDKKYQFIVLGEVLNSYQNPIETLLDLLSLIEEGGVLLFPIYNMDNIYEFLWQQGILGERNDENYQRMPYEQIVDALKNIPLKKIDICFEAFSVIEQVKNFTEQNAYPGLKEGREERIGNLFVRKYWFWIQKA